MSQAPGHRRSGAPLAAALALLAAAFPAAAERLVEPGGSRLAAAIAAAAPGDTLVLGPGRHAGPVVVDRAVTLIGRDGAVLAGGGAGRVLTVDAPDVTVRGLEVTGSGLSLATEDAGIFVTPGGDRVRIESNRLVDNLIGVYLKGPQDAVVVDNTIEGRRDLRMNERGNGVQIWNSPGSRVVGNRIRFGRDGIFVTTSTGNVFRDNQISDLRFAVHYMYTNDSEVSGNVSRGNHMAYALMFSHRIEVHDNTSEDDRDRGLLLNYANDSTFTGNRVVGGPEKCAFIYNANRNRFAGNHLEGCEIGIHFTAGSEGNTIVGNAFVANRTQVKYVGTRHVEWSEDGRGNYWSDNSDFDLDGDGIAERPYRPNDVVDQIVWRHPLARLLLASPAVQLMRFAQSEFPGLHPGGVTDSAPLMRLPGSGAEGSGS